MPNRHIRNARMGMNVAYAIHDSRSPIRAEVMEHRETGVQWAKDMHAAHEAKEHALRRVKGV